MLYEVITIFVLSVCIAKAQAPAMPALPDNEPPAKPALPTAAERAERLLRERATLRADLRSREHDATAKVVSDDAALPSALPVMPSTPGVRTISPSSSRLAQDAAASRNNFV